MRSFRRICWHIRQISWRKRRRSGEKEGRRTKKERFTRPARLCSGDHLLKVLGSVASYLADRSFNLSNDNYPVLLNGFPSFTYYWKGIWHWITKVYSS